MALRAFSLEAHAKLNLRLEVGPLAGSLHELVSVVAELELADELHFAPSPSGFRVTCEPAAVAEHDNIAWRAAHALGRELPRVHIDIEKNIPMQAGLGGGSADAAAALEGLVLIFSDDYVPLTHEQLFDSALRTGSDVPSFLTSGLRIVSGVGEKVVRYEAQPPPWGIVLLRPAIGSSTAQAYALLDGAGVPHRLGEEALQSADAMCKAYESNDFDQFVELLHNDFTEVIERSLPPVARARERLEAAASKATILCGSGSCVAGFFDTRTAARSALANISLDEDEWGYATGFSSD